jgi:hypothetical protein
MTHPGDVPHLRLGEVQLSLTPRTTATFLLVAVPGFKRKWNEVTHARGANSVHLNPAKLFRLNLVHSPLFQRAPRASLSKAILISTILSCQYRMKNKW